MSSLKSSKKYYIDKKKFYEQMSDYIKKVQDAEIKGLPRPSIPTPIAQAFIEIVHGVSTLPKFSRYSYKDEMIGNALENLVKYAHKFDPNDSKKNPFGYFSMFAFRSFIRTIKTEQKSAYEKAKIRQTCDLSELSDDDMGQLTNMYGVTDNDNEIIRKFEERLEREKEKKKLKNDEIANTDSSGTA